MGAPRKMKRYRAPAPRSVGPAPPGLKRRRPRDYAEWRALREWGQLPSWEVEPVGYRLRWIREQVGLTQAELAERLGVSQQAVSRAERWGANPTMDLLERWTEACGGALEIGISPPTDRVDDPPSRG